MKQKVFDMEVYLPPKGSTEGSARALAGPTFERLPARDGYGFANYETIFGPVKGDSPRSLETIRDSLDEAGVVGGLVVGESNKAVAEAVAELASGSGTFFGFARLNPFDGMLGVREFERLVKDEGFRGFSVGSLWSQVPASDRRYYPFYAKCVELNVPVRIYCAMTYANDRAYDLGHPRHVDTVAVDFPELRIVAGLGGWPWVSETVALVRRHPKLYLDTAAHRPRHFKKAGSGWEALLQFGNTLLQDKVMVGLSSGIVGVSESQIIAEYQELGLKEEVLNKWLYANAAEFFEL